MNVSFDIGQAKPVSDVKTATLFNLLDIEIPTIYILATATRTFDITQKAGIKSCIYETAFSYLYVFKFSLD